LAYEGTIRTDRNIRQRATLYAELAFGQYLLYTLETGKEADIFEAVKYLNDLAQELKDGLLPSLSPSDFTSSQAEVVTPISQAASFTAPVTVITENIEVIDLSDNENQ
jgi:hypothetical protein